MENNYTPEHKSIVVECHKEGLSDDEIMESLYTSGVSFKDLKSTFNSIMVDTGLRTTPKQRKEKIYSLLQQIELPTEGQQLKLVCESLINKLNITMKQLMVGIKGYYGEKGVDVPKIPRKVRGGQGFTKNYKVLTDYMLENKHATREQLMEFASTAIPKTKNDKDNSVIYANKVWNMVLFAKEFNS